MDIDFSKSHILVVGDLMLDRYHFGKVSRISPEAPVPVAHITETKNTLGGAGNVANNLVHLGVPCTLIGTLGEDENGNIIKERCLETGIDLKAIRSVSSTIVKTRVIGDHQQIVRIDFEDPLFIDSTSKNELYKAIDQTLGQTSIVILSDYGKGICSSGLCSHIINNAQKRNLQVLIDPKGSDWTKYKNANVITPNLKELSDISNIKIDNTDSNVEAVGSDIRMQYNFENLLVTRSECGMSLISSDYSSHFPTEAQEVFDVSGAGDTVMATLAASLASGFDISSSTRFANKAAGIVCGKIGTAPIELDELQSALNFQDNIKLLNTPALVEKINQLKSSGKTIVFTNGCFDLLHRGHIHLFREARKLGNILIVAINSDDSIHRIKDNRYPINSQDDRAQILSSIKEIDYVAIFNEATPESLLSEIMPDIIVKGGNYNVSEIIGKEYAKKAITLPILQGYSKQDISKKLKKFEK